METLTKPMLNTADRLQQALSGVARLLDQAMNDVQSLDSEVQEHALRAAQEMEAVSERQWNERMRIAVEEAELNTRILVTDELQQRFNQEMARMEADLQRASRLHAETKEEHDRAIAEANEGAAIALERQIARAVDRVRNESAAKWDAERAQLVSQRDRAIQALAERDAEHQQALALVDRFRHELAEERERSRRELERAVQAAQQHTAASSIDMDALRSEVSRVEKLVQEISRIIEDPATELSIVIRKNAERIELESYLKGIRFSIPK